MAVVKSRVTNTGKSITSYTGVSRAQKARETLQTAQVILQASGASREVIRSIQPYIEELTREIANYYRKRDDANR